MNTDKLREALIEHGVDEALQKIRDSDQWEYSHAVEYAATCAAAAVADNGRESLWCVAHASTGPTDPEGRGICWFFMFADAMRTHAGATTKHLDCEMVPARLLIGGDE